MAKTDKERQNGMAVGGIDPSILRELSGVYKPFIKAFKELISNSFDADAEQVSISFSDDFASVVVTDNGSGMNPFEFRGDFTRIGGSSRRWTSGKSPKGRQKIGSKGIGFLALARYADRMTVESFRPSIEEIEFSTTVERSVLDVAPYLGVPIPASLLEQRISVNVTKGSSTQSLASRHYKFEPAQCRLRFPEYRGPVSVRLKVDCRSIAFRATLDFSRLLKLADQANLEQLSDFALIDVFSCEKKRKPGTSITVDGLKPFVRRELRSDRRRGNVKNVVSLSGLEQFNWHLSRCTPVRYGETQRNADVVSLLKPSSLSTLNRLEVNHAGHSYELQRPIYPLQPSAPALGSDLLSSVDIKENGLHCVGFLAGYESVIYPAEFRGISVRVRGVAIGDPTFFGAEYLLTGAQKAALSQITGEINVLSGLDAVDALNPGREGFYEESEHFLILRRYVRGEGESIGGLLQNCINAVLHRSQAKSAVNAVVGRAVCIRRAVNDVSAGVTHIVAKGGKPAIAVQSLLKGTRSHVNGLASAKDYGLGIPTRVGGMTVVPKKGLAEHSLIDHSGGCILIDPSRPEWSKSIVLFNRTFDLCHKQGSAAMPIAELDLANDKIYVNWGHPIRAQMDERGFLRTALSWLLARASSEDADQMMEIAVTLLSYTAETND